MVTSNKLLDKKVVKMAEQNNSAVVPQRTLLGEVNEHITCPLCSGYYIDATTIVECLHSFCRSCIIKHLQVKSYCPVCEMMINSAKPNIKLDKALQDIVYKLVPGLFQKEMERRQQFYSSRPGPAASATPEQRGEDTERIIFSPEDVISFSLEYSDATDTDSISSKSSDSNEPQSATGTTRRFLQCPAVVNISHLKKFLSMKYDIDSTQFAIDILYKRVPLPDYYTLMDIAYIYNWKRNEPMRFFYQIIDYVAIRNRLFDIKSRKSSPTPTEDTNVSSPAPNLNDQGSEMSSGTDSPMPDENTGKKSSNTKTEKNSQQNKDNSNQDKPASSSSTSKKNDDEVEKSQFLNSFELTAKSNNSQPVKSSPVKGSTPETSTSSVNVTVKDQLNLPPKVEDTLKRKQQTPPKAPEMKKLKIELEKAKIPYNITSKQASPSCASPPGATESSNKSGNVFDNLMKKKDTEDKQSPKSSKIATPPSNTSAKEQKPQVISSKAASEGAGIKRAVPGSTNMSSPKRKPTNEPASSQLPSQTKQVSPLKLQIPKLEAQTKSSISMPKPSEVPKPPPKRMPDLKPTAPSSQTSQSKGPPPVNKLRMDLLANNCDPTMDRSKILSQVKSSLGAHNAVQTSGDPLKSLLLDSCKINIPSSLSITLTDQKLDSRSSNDPNTSEPKKNNITNKNLVPANTAGTAHKVPSPPVHNYIEILKLPDSNPKKPQNKTDSNTDNKSTPQGKTETSTAPSKPPGKSSESSAKGPVPNLKPIADTKLGKQSGNFASPITFQQTFEQQLQSLQSDKKSKLPKNKAQVPKLVPATPKSFSAANKLNNPINKSPSSSVTMTVENKPSAALDLTTPHNMQSQIGQHQSRLLETMQSIANLAKKQNQPVKGLPTSMTQGNVYSSISNRPATTGASPLRIPNPSSQVKHDKAQCPSGGQTSTARQDMPTKSFPLNQVGGGNSIMSSPSYQPQSHNSPSTAQPSPRSQTRSPSSSPKLVIAEEKQASSSSSDSIVNQSNQITSTQLPNLNTLKNDSPKPIPGPSKPGPKPMKPLTPSVKLTGIRQPITPTLKSSPSMNVPTDYLTSPQLMAQHAAIMPHIRQQMEIQNWYKAKQYDLFKSMANAVQNQHDFNNKDKQ